MTHNLLDIVSCLQESVNILESNLEMLYERSPASLPTLYKILKNDKIQYVGDRRYGHSFSMNEEDQNKEIVGVGMMNNEFYSISISIVSDQYFVVCTGPVDDDVSKFRKFSFMSDHVKHITDYINSLFPYKK